jgi:hypothetical protein
MIEFTRSYANFVQINQNMLQILVIQRLLDNHIDFEWKLFF